MALVERKLGVSIRLENGTFDESRTDTITLPARLRMAARLAHAGGPSDGTLDLVIWGMTKSIMNQLSTLGMQINLVPKNSITVTAGSDDVGMATAFVGYIIAAYADFNASPEVAFHISAHTLAPQSVIPAKATSFEGATDVATIMSGFATLMGLKFENSGVTTQLHSPYYSGSVKTQAQACVEEAGISWNNGALGTLAIWPKNGSRGGQIPLVSKLTGMSGYPTYTAYGIMVRTLYNPSITFGAKIRVESEVIKPGEWAVYGLDHELSVQMPDGQWMSSVLAYNPTYPTPVR